MSTAISRSLPFVLLGFLTWVAASCSPERRFDYNGLWVGNRNLDRPDLDEVIRFTAGRVTLEIKESKFELTKASVPTGGDVTFEGDHIVLTTRTYIDRPLSDAGKDAELMHPPIKVTPKADGSLLFEDPRAIDGKPLILRRATEQD